MEGLVGDWIRRGEERATVEGGEFRRAIGREGSAATKSADFGALRKAKERTAMTPKDGEARRLVVGRFCGWCLLGLKGRLGSSWHRV